MKRRQFLAAPAVSLLLPASEALAGFAGQPVDTDAPQGGAQAEKFQQRVHQDFITYRPGVEYFYLGNGEIHAAVQYAPDRTGSHPLTFLGLTIMDAEHFSRKWSTFLFHPERGFERSMLTVFADGKAHVATPETLKDVTWSMRDEVPVVTLHWTAGDLQVREEFFVPDAGPYLVRTVKVTQAPAHQREIVLGLALTPNFGLFDEIGPDPKTPAIHARGYSELSLRCLDGKVEAFGRYDLRVTPESPAPGEDVTARFIYAIRPGTPAIAPRGVKALWERTVAYWRTKPVLRSSHPTIAHLHAVARSGLTAHLARSGKRDSGYWMYNMEWVRDDVMMMQGMAMAGFHGEARAILEKILTKSVGPDGCAAESSRFSGYDYTELDQNGQILFAAWIYLSWTGDAAFIRKYWKKITAAGDFPLMEVFRDAKSGLLRNKREFWERDDRFGVMDGYEMNYQFWVSYGLEKGAAVARILGDAATADRWEKEAARLKSAMLDDPRFRFVEDGHLIKRRTRDGQWQQYFIPANRAAMPPGSPIATIARPACDPDTGTLYPIIYEMVDPAGPVSRKTLAFMDALWNQRWDFGGYARYNTDSEPDPPGPWPIASVLIARAALEAGDHERVWRALQWIATIHGGRSGGWFERYGPSITPPAPPVSVVGWVWAEVELFMVHHLLGFRPDLQGIHIRPRLLSGVDSLGTRFTIRGAEVVLDVERGSAAGAVVNGKTVPMKEGAITIPFPKKGTSVTVKVTVV